MNKKIGLFFGVFVPNVTMMFGVILFLRLGLIVSHAGLSTTIAIVSLGLVIMLITSASIASIVSNMEVGAGGVYYIVTRSLGLEIGGALGYALYISQLLSIALTTSGFAYTLVEIYPQFNVIWVELITLAALTLLTNTSAKLALKFQGIILITLVASLIAIFCGSATNLPAEEVTTPFYAGGHLGFWVAFALFYPALTGIEAGMALSGNLKDPSKSLAYGNALSLVFVGIAYVALILFAHYNIPHSALSSDPFAFVYFASPSWLVTLGICAATLSSALGSLMGAPRILQSIANDGLTHSILAKTYGPHLEPRWALLLTAILALTVTIFSNIDQIIPMLSMICLLSYALLNIIAMLGSLMNAPSWRPQFKVHYLISLFGAMLCFITMFMVNAGWAFAAIFLLSSFYFILRKFRVKATFSDIRNSILFFISRLALYRLSNSMNHALTWHPIILVLTKSATKQLSLAKLTNGFARQSGLLSFATIVPESWSDPKKILSTRNTLETFYNKENIECLVEVLVSENEHSGNINLIKTYGIGQIQPNTVVVPIFHQAADHTTNLPHNHSADHSASYELLEYFYTCYLMQKNIILYQNTHEETTLTEKSKKIDLWWSSESRVSFDLLISLISTLSNCPEWGGSQVTLKVMTTSEEALNAMELYLNGFVKKSRLKMLVKIYLDADSTSDYSGIHEHSTDADLIAIPLNPLTEHESFNFYEQYLNSLFVQTKDISCPCLYICSFDNTDHREGYIYPVS